jgi:hypothetical protein
VKHLLPSFRSLTLPLCLFFMLCFWCGAGSVSAQEAIVRAHAKTNDTVWVGQKVAVVVEVLAPGYFSSAVSFDFPDPQGVLLMAPLGSPIMSSETISNISYTAQRHELSAFPMRAGQQTIPAMTLHFSFKRAPLDTNEVPATLATLPMAITVIAPPGAENLGQVISARDLKLEETWRPEPGKTNVIAGAAFVRTVTFTAPDVPGMVFPPFPAGQIDGLGIYKKQQLLDLTDNGSLRGGRRDVITYVCQRSGDFTIPAVRFIWFDLASKQLSTNDLPTRTFDVVDNPALATATGTNSTGGFAWRSVVWWAFAVSATVILLALFASSSSRLRHLLAGLFNPLRPLHLEPLNPSKDRGNGNPYANL